MISVGLPSDALSQNLLSYLGFSYLGHGACLYGCSNKAQPLFLTLTRDFPGGSDSKVSAYNAEDLGLIPGLGRSPAEGSGNPV